MWLARMPVVVRDGLVRARAKLINAVRGIADSEGVEIASASADKFTRVVSLAAESMPAGFDVILLLTEPVALSMALYTEHCIRSILKTMALSDRLIIATDTSHKLFCPACGQEYNLEADQNGKLPSELYCERCKQKIFPPD